MSARSAAARKKITTTQKKPSHTSSSASRPRQRGYPPAEYDYSYAYGQYGHYAPPPPPSGAYYAPPPPHGYQHYHQHQHQPAPPPPPPPESVIGTSSSGSQSAPSEIGDVSGIERSGFRTMMDKKTDGVRRGLAKTFTFNKKKAQEDGPVAEEDAPDRPESSSTARQNSVDDGYAYDRLTSPTLQTHNLQHYPPAPTPQPQGHHYPGPYPPPPHHSHYYQHPSPVSPVERWEISSLGPPPSAELPAVPQQNPGPSIKRWVGGGRPPSRWNKLRKDPELWNPNGDVLVFLHGQEQDQPASFRLSSHVIEASENRWLITELRNGFIEDGDEASSPPPAPSPIPHYSSHRGQFSPLPSTPDPNQLEGEISYEMRFPTPKGLSRTEKIRHQITTRNVFAMLCHASLVGTSLHQALVDLHARLESYRSPGEPDPAGQIISYVSARSVDDTRNDAESAVGLLAWAERPGVKWSEGWREAFLHCAGMYGGGQKGLERCADWKFVAPQTRALLERSWLEMRLKVQTAEERLAEFTFSDLWTGGASSEFRSTLPVGSAKATAERFQKMLMSHYTKTYGSWPPRVPTSGGRDSNEDEEIWLTRTVAKDLQRDFGALYDYIVDKQVIWDVSEARAGRKWMMVSAGWNKGFDADVPSMPMTDIIIEFDNRLRVPHIPHPHPLLPSSIPPQQPSTYNGGGGLFRSSSGTQLQQQGKHAGRDRRVALAYTESTNIDALDTAPCPSGLVDAFSRFEKSDSVGDVDPAMARRGRWVLLYGILQALAPVSVDAPRTKYTDGVTYHLSARLKKPSWSKNGRSQMSDLFGEVRHDMSYCWTAPARWAAEAGGQTTGDEEGEEDDEEEEDEEEEILQEGYLSDGARPPRSLPALSEGGSSVRTSFIQRPSPRRFDDGSSEAVPKSPKSRFYAHLALPAVPGMDGGDDSFLNIDDVVFPTPRPQQQRQMLQQMQKMRISQASSGGGRQDMEDAVRIRDFDDV